MPEASSKPAQLRDWMVLVVCGALCVAAFFSTGQIPGRGDQVEVEITVIPADRYELGCAMEQGYGPFRCAYERPMKNEPKVEVEHRFRLAPYVTTGRELVILGGVFGHPGVVTEAKKRVRRPKSKRRFTVVCQVELLQKKDSVPIRFAKRTEFVGSEPAWIAKTLACSVR